MATLAVRAAGPHADVLLATHDKDLFQLVNDSIVIVPVTGRNDVRGIKEIEAKTGVHPSQIVDWLALIGDSADNIKGVYGIGPKTATKLLASYGSIDGILSHLHELPDGKLKKSLEDSGALLERNRKMVQLYTDLDGIPDWDGFALKTPSVSDLLHFYDKYEFSALAKALREPELF
jgi:DNA polymerase-1